MISHVLRAGALATAVLAAPAMAQTFPSRPITVVVGYAAGGGGDIVVRYFAAKMQELAGSPVVVVNKVGAGGNIGAASVAAAKPDGYTILMAPNIAFLGNPRAYKDPGYKLKDFTGVTTLALLPFVVAVGPKSPMNSISDVVASIKAKSGKFTYGGTTTTAVLAMELFLGKIGGTATKVPYKSMGDSVPDLDGSLDMVIADGTFAAGQARAGRMKLLAVTTPKRAGAMPDLPTMEELGYAPYDVPAWWAAYAPAQTPPDAVAKMERWLNKIVASEETKNFLRPVATDPYAGDAAMLNRLMAEESAKWAKMMDASNIPAQ